MKEIEFQKFMNRMHIRNLRKYQKPLVNGSYHIKAKDLEGSQLYKLKPFQK